MKPENNNVEDFSRKCRATSKIYEYTETDSYLIRSDRRFTISAIVYILHNSSHVSALTSSPKRFY